MATKSSGVLQSAAAMVAPFNQTIEAVENGIVNFGKHTIAGALTLGDTILHIDRVQAAVSMKAVSYIADPAGSYAHDAHVFSDRMQALMGLPQQFAGLSTSDKITAGTEGVLTALTMFAGGSAAARSGEIAAELGALSKNASGFFAGGGSIAAGEAQIVSRSRSVGRNVSSFFDASMGRANRTYLVDPVEVGFSQSSVSRVKTRFDMVTGKKISYSFDDIASSMRINGWQGMPLNVVRMPDGTLTSIDNTRLLAARIAGIKAKIKIHEYDAPLPEDLIKNFIVEEHPIPKTWGQALHTRVNVQDKRFFQNRIFYEKFRHGSIYDPDIIGVSP